MGMNPGRVPIHPKGVMTPAGVPPSVASTMREPEAPDHDGPDREPHGSRRGLRPFDRRLLGRLSAARWALGADLAAGLLGTLLLLAQVTLLAAILAQAAQSRLREVPTGGVVALVVIIVARSGLAHVVEVSGRRAATRVMSALRADLVRQRLRPGAADQRDGGGAELAAGAVQGVDGLETYFARYLPQVVLAVTVPVAVLVWTAVVDLQSALIMLVTLPVIPVFMALIGRSAGARSRANWRALVRLEAHFLDVVRGLPTLRAFNRGAAQRDRIAEATDRYRRTTMSTLRLSFLSGVVLDLGATLSTALVAVDLGVRLVGGTLALRPALTVLLLVPELYAPIRTVGTLFHASADGLAAVEGILDRLDRAGPEETRTARTIGVSRNGQARIPDPATEPIAVRSLTVRYAGRASSALDGLDLDIGPGQLVAVMGPSGAGKTTLGRVLLGLARPSDGTVLIGGKPLARVDRERWRDRVAWAPQHPALLPGTVAENIALGRPDADAATIERAARQAAAHPFIEQLPQRYDTRIGGGGRGLSAGQRQRLGLARALLRDASLLVLDEPTVHLDETATGQVANAIAELRASRTIVLITHEPALAERADLQVWLDRGRRIR
jgi:ATP-binding cassette, subfamily C, bacterial CydD